MTSESLTIVENTFERIHCRIFASPPITSNIEWFKNDQLILGTRVRRRDRLREDERADHCFARLFLGENHEQLRINFVGIEKLACRARNTVGETEASLDVNILCKNKIDLCE